MGGYWVKGVTAPVGWSFNSALGTSGLSPVNVVSRGYAFQLPATLTSGRTYTSGTDFMGVSRTSAGSTTSQQSEFYKGSGGVFALTKDNPVVPDSCQGTNIAIVIDLSASVGSAVASLRAAAKAYIDVLAGTPSTVQVFSFGTTASQVSSGRVNVADAAAVTALKAQIDRLTSNSGSYTNWDDAFWDVTRVAGTFDMAVVITDGNPTVHGPSGSTSNGSGNTRFIEVEDGIFSANALKAEGTHIQVMAVGDGITNTHSGLNLAAISSPTDFVKSSDYDEVAKELRSKILKNCTPSISVTKLVEAWDSSTRAPASGWEFTADVSGHTLFGGDLATQETGSTGAIQWLMRADSPQVVGSATVTETMQPGYQLVQQGGKNAVCTVTNETTPYEGRPLTIENAGGLGFTVPSIGAGDMVKCTVVNKAPAPPTAALDVTPARVVDYDWKVDKSVTPDSALVRPGTDADFEYTLTVSATKQDTHLSIEGTVTLTNASTRPVPVSLATVKVDGQAVPLENPDAMVPAAVNGVPGTAKASFTWATTTAPTGRVPVVVSIEGRQDVSTTVDFSGVVPETTDRYADLADTFPELALEYGAAISGLDAEDYLTGGTFTYTAARGSDVVAGGSENYPNTATVTPTDPPQNGDDQNPDDQDPDDLTSSETVTVSTGRDLSVTKAMDFFFARAWVWDIDKDADAHEKLAGPDSDADGVPDATFAYTATPSARIESTTWTLTGEITVSNPNPWEVDATAVVDIERLDEATSCTVAGGDDRVTIPAADAAGPGTRTFAVTCTYDGLDLNSLDGILHGVNVARVTWDAEQAYSASDMAEVRLPASEIETTRTLTNQHAVITDDFAGTVEFPVTLGHCTASLLASATGAAGCAAPSTRPSPTPVALSSAAPSPTR